MSAQNIRRRYLRRVVSAAVLTRVVSYAVMQSVIGPVLPQLQRQLHTNQGLVSWVMTGYLLSASVCTPIAGRLGEATASTACYSQPWSRWPPEP